MLVIDEAFDMWIYGNNPYDYHLYFRDWWKSDIESIIRRDINHPSVILWSIGNEIGGMDSSEIVAVANDLAVFVRELDNTRPVTAAVNSINAKKDPFFAALDICGYNYGRKSYVSDHQRMPGRIMFCTESYPLEAFEYWTDAKKYSWVAGDFVWTAFDYIGEASIGWRGYFQEKNFYPWNTAYCGDIDICGWKRPQSFYRDALWGSAPTLSIFVKPPQPTFPVNPKREDWSIWHWEDAVDNWTWKGVKDVPLEVKVYSSCEKVELFLNNKSLGTKVTSDETRYTASWMVPYHDGEIRAVGYKGSKKIKESKLTTAGSPVKIVLSADKSQILADNQDLSYITVELHDEKGIRNSNSEDLVSFELSGPGSILAVANGNPMSQESFQKPEGKAWRGRCLVVVKSGKTAGEITLKASVQGLPSSEISIITSSFK
jgi:beta-galactosidase